jgi:hypothetical protein
MRSLLETVALVLGLAACASSHESGSVPAAIDACRDCVADASPADGGWTTLGERPCPKASSLTYENFGAPFFLTWCEGCHSTKIPEGSRQNAPLTMNFNTLDDVRAHKDRIWARAADSNSTMPPAGGPSANDRAMLGEWLACGAP